MTRERRDALTAAAVIGAVVLVAYGMTLRAPLIFDDVAYVRDTPIFRLPPGEFLSRVFSSRYFALTQPGASQPLATWQPLVAVLHYPFAGQLPLLRLVGILLHAANAWLVWALARRLGAGVRGAYLAALAFAFFPPSTEAVNLVSFKSHVLVAFFLLLCVHAWAAGRGAFAYAAFALALLSKETAVAGAAVLAAWELLVERRTPPEAARRLAGFAVLVAAYFVARFAWLEAAPALPAYSPGPRLGGLSFAWYVRLLAVPVPLCLERSLPDGPWAWLAWLAPLSALAALWRVRRDRLAAFALAWFIAGLLPMLHLIRFANYSPVADRYLYLASAGACLLFAHAVFEGPLRLAPYAALAAWVGLTVARNGLYLEPAALFRQAADCAPANPRPFALLGLELYHDGRIQEARDAFQKAYDLDPGLPQVVNNLAGAELALGEAPRAETLLRRALKLEPDSAAYHENLAAVLLVEGRKSEAETEFRLARRLGGGYK